MKTRRGPAKLSVRRLAEGGWGGGCPCDGCLAGRGPDLVSFLAVFSFGCHMASRVLAWLRL